MLNRVQFKPPTPPKSEDYEEKRKRDRRHKNAVKPKPVKQPSHGKK